MVDFLIVGAQKSGTTAAAHNLDLHPQLSVFSGVTEYGQREIEFFNQHWDRGKAWYFSHFEGLMGITGEKTAELLHRTGCHARISATVPEAKLIVLLRCPVQRAFSQWRMARYDKQDETRSFEQVVKEELLLIDDRQYLDAFSQALPGPVSSWREGYLLKGLYLDQLRSLSCHFTPAQILVLISERVRVHMGREYSRVFEHLGVDNVDCAFAEHFPGKGSPLLSAATARALSDFYREPNEALFRWLGFEVPEWT